MLKQYLNINTIDSKLPNKKYTYFILIIFVIAFPFIEGFSNEFMPIGTKYLGVIVGFIWSIETLYSHRLPNNNAIYLLFIYLTWNIASMIWTTDVASSSERVVGIINVSILYLIVSDIVDTDERVRQILLAYSFGVLLVILSSVYNVYSQQTYQYLSNRYSAIGIDPNNFGIMVVSAIPLIYATMIYNTQRIVRLTGSISLFLCIVATFSTGSRAALLSLLIVIISFAVLYRNKLGGIRNLIIFFVIFSIFSYLAAKYLVPEAAFSRILSSIVEDRGGGRLIPWSMAFDLGMGNPFTGIGAGAFLSYTEGMTSNGIQAHNTFLSAFAELGLVGFFLWSTLWLYHYVLIYRHNMSYSKDSTIYCALLISLNVILIGAITLNWEIRKPIYLLWGIIAANKRDV